MTSLRQLFPEWSGVDQSLDGLTLDSRAVQPGWLFLALPGASSDGRRHITEAVAAGARAVAYESADGFCCDPGVPAVAVPGLRRRLSALAGLFHGEPSRQLGVLGVTGTNGKTSVSQMLAQALQLLGEPCGVIGTLGSGMPGQLQSHGMTTPDPIGVQRQLAELLQQGARWVSMEVSSHALDQQRVAAVRMCVALFTNLSRDHLDYHGDMHSYGEAKARLFTEQPIEAAVINLDDEFGASLPVRCQVPVIGYSLQQPQAQLFADQLVFDADGIHARVHWQGRSHTLHSPLLGRFNLYNLLAVLGGLLALQRPIELCLPLLAQLQAPAGRMQRLGGDGLPLVVVDYAHTPDALHNALAALRAHTRGRLLCVFGCGGDRDRGKRPLMAEAAEAGADAVLVTSDNPRSEAPQQIIDDILVGLRKPQPVEADRGQAIRQAILQADAADVILLAGKGHEDYQEIAGVKYPFSDIEQAQAALAARGETA